MQLGDLFLVALVLVADELLNELRGLIPEVVVADVLLDLAVVDVHDVGADGVQEVAVVADYDDKTGVLVVHDEVFQPVDCLNIEVVGRLVEQNDIRLTEKRLRKQDLHLLAAVRVGHKVIVLLDRDAETLQKAARVGFGLPAVHFRKLRLQLAGAEAVRLGEILFFVERVLFLHHVVEMLIAHDDGVKNGIFVVLELILLEDGHARALLDGDIAGGRLQLPGENFQKGGFSGAVCADDAVAVAGQKLQICVFEQNGTAELHGEIGYCNHDLLLFGFSLIVL